MFNFATREDIEELRKLIEKKPDKLDKDTYERIADLEIKIAKLWAVLIQVDSYGKEKPSKFARRFGGMSKSLLNNQ